jgi:hypothetical protein
MTVKLLISGPIRPSVADVLDIVQTIKRQVPDSEIFLSTWTTDQDVSVLKANVDHYIEHPEPSDTDVLRMVTARSKQQYTEAGAVNFTFPMFKMVLGIRLLIEYANTRIQPTDTVIRIRTDSMFLIEPSYLAGILKSVGDRYYVRNRVTSGANFDDWFAITSFRVFKRVWYIPTLAEYNALIQSSWNIETLLKTRASEFMHYLDDTKIECYLRRANGDRNYHK